MITDHPDSVLNLGEGQNTMFSVVATGDELSYQWLKDNVELMEVTGDIEGTTTPTLTLTGVAPSDAGEYTVRVSNDAGMVPSNAATLSVGTYLGLLDILLRFLLYIPNVLCTHCVQLTELTEHTRIV